MFCVFSLVGEWHLLELIGHLLTMLNWPELHFRSLIGVVIFFACLPVDAISVAPVCTHPVHPIQVGVMAVIVPPRSLVFCGTVKGAHVIVLICC